MTPRAGTTLIEVLVTLVIIAIFAAVSIPAFVRLQPIDALQTTADQLAEVLRSTRGAAIAAARPTSVTIDPATGRFWIVGGPDGDSTLAAGHVDVPTDAKIMAPRPRLAVTFRGASVAAGDTIVLVSSTRLLTVSADPWSAEVRIGAR